MNSDVLCCESVCVWDSCKMLTNAKQRQKCAVTLEKVKDKNEVIVVIVKYLWPYLINSTSSGCWFLLLVSTFKGIWYSRFFTLLIEVKK